MISPATTTNEYDGTHPSPRVLSTVPYLLLNLPVGIFWFVTLVTLTMVGLGTSIIWVGVPLLMLAAVLCRGAATLERGWVHTMLGVYIARPYRPLPSGFRAYWRARLGDPATWRDLAYFLLLLPFGIVEFAMMIALWSTGLGLLALPVYFRFLPPDGSWRLFDTDHPWVVVDSTLDALPWAVLGALVCVLAVLVTRWLGMVHARFARGLLGPSEATVRRLDETIADAGAR